MGRLHRLRWVPVMRWGHPGDRDGIVLISRDVIAMASGIALSHNIFDAAIYLGVCDKIVPGLVIAAATLISSRHFPTSWTNAIGSS